MITTKFLEAIRFATINHAQQRRSAANRKFVPYMVHPLEAAQILVECGIQDEDILIAAVLHDVLEDTEATEEEIAAKFGKSVLGFVKENTDDPALDRPTQKHMQIVNAKHKSGEASLIKMADKASNMRDLVRVPPPWPEYKIKAYVMHAREVVKALTEWHKEIPATLIAAFWQPSQDALDAVAEAELKLKAQMEKTK